MTAAKFADDMPLAEARALLRTLVADGCICPCCTQNAQVYSRPLHAGMARQLLTIYRTVGTDWAYLPDVLAALARSGAGSGDVAKLRYWGLLEQQEGVRDDGSNRTGHWRVTLAGREWVLGRTTVPQRALVYNRKLLRLTGDPITIRDALGKKFNYDELMAGT